MIKMASCDQSGEVYITDDSVYRIIAPESTDKILSLVDNIKNNFSDCGIVETDIVDFSDNIYSEFCLDKNTRVLKHEKIKFISYPHEWCASMLKDAALFSLNLAVLLHSKNLYIKDLHPWNILFSGCQPIMIDFTSLVDKETLFSEKYLISNTKYKKESDDMKILYITEEILKRTFVPYFFMPLLGYYLKKYKKVHNLIENATLNASTYTINFANYALPIEYKVSKMKEIAKLIRYKWTLKKLFKFFERNNVIKFYKKLYLHILNMNVDILKSDYSDYYELKSENVNHIFSEDWNNKQKTVYNELKHDEIYTVLDVASNTGWYAVLAAKLGKKVVAFDIDDACVELLYKRAKEEKLDILPLVVNFNNITKDRYSTEDGNYILLNGFKRFQCDAVLVLGILHHLILGEGRTFEEVVQELAKLCSKKLILEFIDLNDKLIQNNRGFFKAYDKDQTLAENYNIENLIKEIGKCFENIVVKKSSPKSRYLLICSEPKKWLKSKM